MCVQVGAGADVAHVLGPPGMRGGCVAPLQRPLRLHQDLLGRARGADHAVQRQARHLIRHLSRRRHGVTRQACGD